MIIGANNRLLAVMAANTMNNLHVIDQFTTRSSTVKTTNDSSILTDLPTITIPSKRVKYYVKAVTISFINDNKTTRLTIPLSKFDVNNTVSKLIEVVKDSPRWPLLDLSHIRWEWYHRETRINPNKKIRDYVNNNCHLDMRQEGLIRIELEYNGTTYSMITDGGSSIRQIIDRSLIRMDIDTAKIMYNGSVIDPDVKIRETDIFEGSHLIISQ